MNTQKKNINGRTYDVLTFPNDVHANKFLEKNASEWGVLHTDKNSAVYVARLEDKGTPIPAREVVVLLCDIIPESKPEKVTINVPEGGKLTDAGHEYMKANYGGKTFKEDHVDSKGRNIRCIFSTEADFFLSWPFKA